ncbi:MAG TPA: M1 family metallopeptidase [Terriglobales bacterium]|nr:M1 family metallopeptidase [Terriglobales bacterium]
MKRPRLLALLLVFALPAFAKYIPDPIVKYKIDARLDPKARTVKGHEVIVWRNHTSDSIPDLQFHTYLNAFKNNYSTFMREGGASSRRVRFGKGDDAWGYIQIHSIKVDGQDLTAQLRYIQPDDGNPLDQTVAQVLLPKPIPANGSVTIEIEWTSKMPRLFARTGFHDNFFMVVQWFPKPGVYEAAGERHRVKGGWNCRQFHTSTEFFADYGSYDVNLTIPSDFELAATGTERSKKDNGDGTTTYNHYQEDVFDFAWTTQPKSQVMKIVRMFKASERVTPAELQEWARKTGAPLDQMPLQDVQVTLFIQREHSDQVERHFRAAFAGIKWFGLMYGKYPFDVLSVIDPPPFQGDGAGGMEYPTLITAGTDYWAAKHRLDPEGVIVHEFGHQFWFHLVGNNEFEEAWLDEGFNSYSTGKVLEMEYGANQSYEELFGVPVPAAIWTTLPVPRYPWFGMMRDTSSWDGFWAEPGDPYIGLGQYWEWVPRLQRDGRIESYFANAKTDAMERYAWLDMNRASYGTQAYSKPELTLRTLENLLGPQWPRIIRTYHQRWRFKHPDAQDFIATVDELSGGRNLKWFFDQTLYGTNTLNYSVSFTNDPAPKKEGLFDQGGQPKLAEDKSKESERPNESEVLVRRVGEMAFPAVIRVKFEDGSEVRELWPVTDPGLPAAGAPEGANQYRWKKFKYAKKVALAEVDPDHAWNLEVARTDNSFQAQPNKLAADKWYLRWVVWIQNVLMGFSYFS